MASSKEMSVSTRPLGQHRPSLSNGTSTGLPARQFHARTPSHSLLTGALNPNHRVTRRKSVTNPGANVAAISAISAALRDGEHSAAIPITNRRNTMSKGSAARAALIGSLPSPPASLPNQRSTDGAVKRELQGSAIDDDSNDMSADEEGLDKLQMARIRRASDGQPLLTKDGKKNRVEVRCEKCGKSYKHSSCLTKHLWEHTPEWSLTSKLLISKHQQVQLLEAASVLVAMNGTKNEDNIASPPDSAKDIPSEAESALSDPSGYSDQDRASSADTTPPPLGDFSGFLSRNKRRSSGSGGFSRSYQSAVSVPNGHGFGHYRQTSGDRRPLSSGLNNSNQEDRDLAAAVELLSCSFGSNNGAGGVSVPADAPPVPPVPAQYREHASSVSNGGFINSFPSRPPESFTRGETKLSMGRSVPEVRVIDGEDDVDMEESTSGAEDEEREQRARGHSDDHEVGVFGMET